MRLFLLIFVHNFFWVDKVTKFVRQIRKLSLRPLKWDQIQVSTMKIDRDIRFYCFGIQKGSEVGLKVLKRLFKLSIGLKIEQRGYRIWMLAAHSKTGFLSWVFRDKKGPKWGFKNQTPSVKLGSIQNT